MNRTGLFLVLLLLPIVAAAQLFVNSWPASIVGVAASRGPIFAAVTHGRLNGVEIWQWSRDLSERETVWRLPILYFKRLSATQDGSLLICDGPHETYAFDVDQRRQLWSRGTVNTSATHLVESDQYLMLVDAADFGNGPAALTLLETRSGEVVDRIQVNDQVGVRRPSLYQVYFDSDLVTLRFSDQQVVSIASDGGKLRRVDYTVQVTDVLASEGKLWAITGQGRNESRRLSPMPTRDSLDSMTEVRIAGPTSRAASAIRIVKADTNHVIQEDHLGVGYTTKCLLAFVVMVGTAVWVMLLMRHGTRSDLRYRAFIDLAILAAFFSLPYVAGLGDVTPQAILRAQVTRIFAVPLGAVACLLFLLLMGTQRKIYVRADAAGELRGSNDVANRGGGHRCPIGGFGLAVLTGRRRVET